jgi:hypothetical protein
LLQVYLQKLLNPGNTFIINMKIKSDFILNLSARNSQFDIEDTNIFLFNRADLPSKYVGFINDKDYENTDIYRRNIGVVNIGIYIYGNVYYRNGSDVSAGQPVSENILLNLYLEKWDDFIVDLKGSFTIIVLDAGHNIIKLFTDQLHPRTVYYYCSNTQLLISSSLSEIINCLKNKNIQLKADRSSILEYYLYDYTLDNSTFIEDIKETEPGQIIEFKDGGCTIANYFDFLNELDLSGPKMSKGEGIELLQCVLKENVRLYDPGPGKTAVALTGGFDSRSIIACFGENYREYQYYSYGRPESWDLKIPMQIAEKINLQYKGFIFTDDFDNKFSEYGEQAVLLGDGVGKFSMANYIYVYSKFFPGISQILTGLFGSELIKRFTGANIAMKNNMLALLKNHASGTLFQPNGVDELNGSFFSKEFLQRHGNELESKCRNNPMITNNLPENQKIFYNLLTLGTRKYFQRELKIQSPWVTNKHPFYDIDFIDALVKTPFPNVYNWELKKSLLRNLRTHELYGAFIGQKPELSGFISTHGFKPEYLRNKIYTPLIGLSYLLYKKKIKSSSGLTFHDLIIRTIERKISEIEIDDNSIFYTMFQNVDHNSSEFIKMFSLFYWLKAHNIEI